MRAWIAALGLGVTLVLSACATSTPYQAAPNGGYGYTQTPIEEGRERIIFRGNSLTERETVEDYLLFRAAELTLERGFDHFFVSERDVDSERRLQSIGPPIHPGFYPHYAYFTPRWGWRSAFDRDWNDVALREVTRYEASAEIVFGRGPKPADDPQAFDARSVISAIGPRVVRPVGP